MFKILQARLQQYMNQEFPGVLAVFQRDRGTRDQTSNIYWIMEKARKFEKNIYLNPLTMLRLLIVWITENCGKFLKRWGYQTILPISWETCTWVKKQQLELDMEHRLFQNCERRTSRLYIVTLLIYYIIQNAWMDESQAGIKIAARNINSLRYTDDTTLLVES